MYWKDIFNSNKKSWGNIQNAYNAAINSGYEFFSWNGWIYEANDDLWGITAIKEEDVY